MYRDSRNSQLFSTSICIHSYGYVQVALILGHSLCICCLVSVAHSTTIRIICRSLEIREQLFVNE